jgi:hypothetical protein
MPRGVGAHVSILHYKLRHQSDKLRNGVALYGVHDRGVLPMTASHPHFIHLRELSDGMIYSSYYYDRTI